jgi:hypothetical protein
MPIATEDYAGVVSTRVTAERLALSTAWLARLHELLDVEVNDVFPTDHLLDHIPTLISEIAAYLRAPAEEEIAANAAVIAKARELGILRHQQKASVHQVLREYEVLGEILETFVASETERLGLQPSSAVCFELQRRLTRSTRTLMRTTVETFISEYTTTIQKQNERMQTFHRMASHELRSHLGTLVFAAALLNTDGVQSDPSVSPRSRPLFARIPIDCRGCSRTFSDWPIGRDVGCSQSAARRRRNDCPRSGPTTRRHGASRHVDIRIDGGPPTVTVDPARLERA